MKVKALTLRGSLAFLGVWACFCAIGELVIQIESFSFIMAWGIIAYFVSDAAEAWIITPSKNKRR